MTNIRYYQVQWGKKTIGFGFWVNADNLERKIGTSVANTKLRKVSESKNTHLYELTTQAGNRLKEDITSFYINNKGKLKVSPRDKREKVYVSEIDRKKYGEINAQINNFIGNQWLAG